MRFSNNIHRVHVFAPSKEEFEDTKGVIKNRKLKNESHLI